MRVKFGGLIVSQLHNGNFGKLEDIKTIVINLFCWSELPPPWQLMVNICGIRVSPEIRMTLQWSSSTQQFFAKCSYFYREKLTSLPQCQRFGIICELASFMMLQRNFTGTLNRQSKSKDTGWRMYVKQLISGWITHFYLLIAFFPFKVSRVLKRHIKIQSRI